jgi:hypothetical protein
VLVVPDECTLFTNLTRPMPSYALQHVFSAHGPVEWVRSQTLPFVQLPACGVSMARLSCVTKGLGCGILQQLCLWSLFCLAVKV